ncbi:MAG TPA: M48 family metallopeptidase [bacterium]
MSDVALGILVSLLAVRAIETAVAVLNLRSLLPDMPPEMEGIYDRAAYERSQAYARATARAGLVREWVDLAALCAFWFAGGFQMLDALAGAWGRGPVTSGLVYVGALAGLSALLSLPFSIHATFVIEERFGFNRTTPRTFALDRVKGVALAAALGGPLLAAVLALFAHAGSAAWLACWAAVAGYTLVVQFVAPTWIMPLFNTFTPLPAGELRERIERYAASVRFSLENVFLMDGSRRSSKSNAFFTGFGRHRRIALFDTLVAQLTTGELVAVLAHEVGHYVRRHVLKGTVVSIVHTGAMLWVLSLLLDQRWLYDAFLVQRASVHAGLVLFGILLTPVEFLLGAALNAWSRRNEYEADRFAAATTADPEAMVAALKKLSVRNLANLTPHPWHVALHYSHPPLLQRIAALRAAGPGATAR